MGAPRRKLPPKPCETCGTEFSPRTVRAKYCSEQCRYHKNMTKRKRIDIPRNMRWSILRRDKFRCLYCGAEPDKAELRVDHVIPIEHGGPRTARTNLVTACNDCNSGKSDDVPDFDELPVTVLRICQPDHPRVKDAA